MARGDQVGRPEDEAACRYHEQRERLERREDALRARERRLNQEAGEFLWDIGRCHALVGDIMSSVPCVAHQAAFAADELASVQSEVSARLDEQHAEIAHERRNLDKRLGLAEEEYRRAMRSRS